MAIKSSLRMLAALGVLFLSCEPEESAKPNTTPRLRAVSYNAKHNELIITGNYLPPKSNLDLAKVSLGVIGKEKPLIAKANIKGKPSAGQHTYAITDEAIRAVLDKDGKLSYADETYNLKLAAGWAGGKGPQIDTQTITVVEAPLPQLKALVIGNKAKKDASDTGWVFQGADIVFEAEPIEDTTGKAKPDTTFLWQWRKRGKDWVDITSQTTATATLSVPKNQRVGAYELKVTASSDSEGLITVDNSADLHEFTVRKAGCPDPSTDTKRQPRDAQALRALLHRFPTSTGMAGGTTDYTLDRDIDTSLITDMTFDNSGEIGAVDRLGAFNSQIDCWDVSNVTRMWQMFYDAIAFNQDIGDWDVSNVTDMIRMFYNAQAFDQDISRWDVSKVTHMTEMFEKAIAFNQNLNTWEVANVLYKSDFATGTTAWNKTNRLPQWPASP